MTFRERYDRAEWAVSTGVIRWVIAAFITAGVILFCLWALVTQ